MSVDRKSQQLSTLNEQSVQYCSAAMSTIPGTQQTSIVNEQSIQSESHSLSGIPDLQPYMMSSAQSAWLETSITSGNLGAGQMPHSNERSVQTEPSAKSVNSGQQHMSSVNGLNRQVESLEPSSTSGVLATEKFHPLKKHSELAESSLKLHGNMAGTSMPHQLTAAPQSSAEMKVRPHSQGSIFLNPSSQQLPSRSKQTNQREPWPKVISISPVNVVGPQLPSTPRGTIQLDQSPRLQKSMSGKMGLQKSSSANKRAAQAEPSPKAQHENVDSIRSKMRESLAASLTVASDEQSKCKSEGKESNEFVNMIGETDDQLQPCQHRSSTICDPSSHLIEGFSGSLTFSGHDAQKNERLQNSVTASFPSGNKNADHDMQSHDDQLKFQEKQALLDNDDTLSENFVQKDELLQENGLFWVSETDTEKNGNRESKRLKVEYDGTAVDLKRTVSENPFSLATKIEAELFRLFGGVNKKYKEKGRSLMFNLKDRSNPELRKQVLSGKISPDRLCSMTAEELASKELSEWRIAKAEELAQMVVLPNSDVDIRRLVKKTHKGEFQVEVEQDDGYSAAVTVGSTSLSQVSSKTNENEMHSKSGDKENVVKAKTSMSKPHEGLALPEKVGSGDQALLNDLSSHLLHKSDIVQDITVEELKDSDFPLIPTLDEFMEDLYKKPPLENLPVDTPEETPISDEQMSDDLANSNAAPDSSKAKLKSVLESLESKQNTLADSLKADHAISNSISTLDTAVASSNDANDHSVDDSSKLDTKHSRPETSLGLSPIRRESNSHSADDLSKSGHIWEGLIQLNISLLATLLAIYKSGEQTATKEWPSFIEIKGRVRLDAFEKFLQELPLSRSRAIMIVQFCWKEGSPEDGHDNLSETIDSYIADERVGYAEPAPGVEIYFCPPHTKTTQMLVKHLSKEHEEILPSINNGLIGVVVWRRPHVTSIISPRPSSHHKHSSKKQSLSRKQQISNASFVPNSNVLPSHVGNMQANINPANIEESNDDAPPGFGPGVARDEDDLPEFDFSRSASAACPSQAQQPSRPVDQMRQLIHKYGHVEDKNNPGASSGMWNDDVDDDIPEWQPHQQTQSHQPAQPLPPPLPSSQLQGYQHQAVQPAFGGQQFPMTPLQQAMQQVHPSNVLQYQQLVPAPAAPQPQMGFIPGAHNVHPGWQAVQWWGRPQGPPDPAYMGNGMIQPSFNYVTHLPVQGHAYGNVAHPQNGMEWNPDLSGGSR